MQENEDVREHINKFFDVVDKLEEMNVDVNADLLSIMLLYSLPASYGNSRCAIETRDDLPGVETLKIKILEESDARRQNSSSKEASNALLAAARSSTKPEASGSRFNNNKNENRGNFRNKYNNDVICYRCQKKGHIAAKCYSKLTPRGKGHNSNNEEKANQVEEVYYVAGGNADENKGMKQENLEERWCLDSGCTTHLCKDINLLQDLEPRTDMLSLADKNSTKVEGRGTVNIEVEGQSHKKIINLQDTLHVPNLRTNLLSVAKIVDKNNEILFKKNIAVVRDSVENKTKNVSR